MSMDVKTPDSGKLNNLLNADIIEFRRGGWRSYYTNCGIMM
ncbi:hypothetical protein [Paenibacillus sp. WC2504]